MVSGNSVGLSSLTVSAGVFGIVGGSVVVSALIGAIGVSTIVSVVVSGTGLCSGRSVAVGSVVSVFGVSMTGSVSLVVGASVTSVTCVSATVVSVGSVCILDKVSDGFAAEHALIRSASSKMMIFFMAFASLRVYGSEK